MDYSLLFTVSQVAGLGLIGGSAVALLRLMLIHYVQRDWSVDQARALHGLTATQSAGLLFLAFSGGGLLAARFIATSDLPPLPAFLVQTVLLSVMASAVVFLHVVARPWLADEARAPEAARPLVMDVSAHRTLAVTLALAALAAAWTLWLVQAGAAPDVPPLSAMLASLALLTLVIWMVLALPSLVLRALAVQALRGETPAEDVPLRMAPLMPEVPQHRPVHVPAPRAPRPRLMARGDGFSG